MDMEHERRLTEAEARSKSNTKRIDKLEESNEAISQLAASMAVMASKQEQVADAVDKLDGKVTDLESKPGRRADALVDKIVWAVLAAIVSFILGRIGL